MARKPATRAEFDLFDVFYTDGTQRSNRRVPREILGGLDGDAPARRNGPERYIGMPPWALSTRGLLERTARRCFGRRRSGRR